MEYVSLEEIAKNLNSISWDILSLLSKKENLSLDDIKSKLNLSSMKIYKEISRLEGGVLINSKKDSQDWRRLNFNITEYGIKILKYK